MGAPIGNRNAAKDYSQVYRGDRGSAHQPSSEKLKIEATSFKDMAHKAWEIGKKAETFSRKAEISGSKRDHIKAATEHREAEKLHEFARQKAWNTFGMRSLQHESHRQAVFHHSGRATVHENKSGISRFG